MNIENMHMQQGNWRMYHEVHNKCCPCPSYTHSKTFEEPMSSAFNNSYVALCVGKIEILGYLTSP